MLKTLVITTTMVVAGLLAGGPASATPFAPPAHILDVQSDPLIQQARVRGRAVVRHGARPGIRPGVRPGVVVRPRIYVNRPWRGRYWRPGIGWAVGTVVAVGVLSAAAAASYAPPPPAPGYCWYYTDPSYRAGYWAECTQ